MMGIDQAPAVRNGNIERAIVAQAAADLGQMRALLSTRKMLDDVVGYDEVEARVCEREFGPAYLGELYPELTRSESTTPTAKVPDSPNPSLEK